MQMQGIGTSFMLRPPVRRSEDGFDRLIGQMSLSEVRAYMCPKSHGNPKECEKCDGFRTCQAGQRAVRLTYEADAEALVRETKPAPADATKERDEFRVACESGNAWYYLMQTRGLSKDAAGELLSKMCRKFPGIAADFGGSRRIMQRPKAVKVEPVRAQEQASGIAKEEMPSGNPEGPEQAKNGRKPDAAIAARAESAREMLRRKCLEAVQSGNIREFLLAQGRTKHNVTNTISRWRKLFPDLMADVPKVRSGRKKQEEPEEELPETSLEAPQEAEDEVSLEDFLAEYEPEKEPAIGARNALAELLEDLRAEKVRLEEEIRKAEDRIRCIGRQMDALTAVISGPA